MIVCSILTASWNTFPCFVAVTTYFAVERKNKLCRFCCDAEDAFGQNLSRKCLINHSPARNMCAFCVQCSVCDRVQDYAREILPAGTRHKNLLPTANEINNEAFLKLCNIADLRIQRSGTLSHLHITTMATEILGSCPENWNPSSSQTVVSEAWVQAQPQKFLFVENPGKIPENLGKKGAQHWQEHRRERAHEVLFLEVIPKKDLHDLCGRRFVGESRTKTFRASFGQKSFAPPKFTCSYIYDHRNAHH